MHRKPPILAIVLPCYNEEKVLEKTCYVLCSKLDELKERSLVRDGSYILFVDDGSEDETWSVITKLYASHRMIEGIRLSKNRGHQVALFAGMEHALRSADAILTMDADLQQDAGAIPLFLEKYIEGYDIVYGIRNNRDSDGCFKRASATLYYRLLKSMGCEVFEQSADYRLMSKRAVEALCGYSESNLFLRGLIPTLGFRSSTVHFDVKDRELGESKYTIGKMLGLALDGITSFTTRPIHLVLFVGILLTLFSVVMVIYTIIVYFLRDTALGWASLSIAIWFIGGVQLTSLGIIGEYIGKGYIESKHRPRYFIEDSCVREVGRDDVESE